MPSMTGGLSSSSAAGDVVTTATGDRRYKLADAVIAVTYNDDGSVATVTEDGVTTTFTYNSDGTVATQVRSGVTRTYTYSSGNLTAVS